MRAPFVIIANWKMNKTVVEAVDYARRLRALMTEMKGAEPIGVEVILAPPLTALRAVSEAIEGGPVGLAAQNVHWEDQGPYTGEVSATQLQEAGCQYVLIGHSERRQHFGEGNEWVNRKVRAALRQGLLPIVCVGESRIEREGHKTLDVVEEQMLKGLADVRNERLLIAYEPVWAIGTGQPVTREQAREVHHFIHRKAGEIWGDDVAASTRVLYGGSVTPANALSLIEEPEVGGFLVGGASLVFDEFSEIVGQAARSRK